MNIPLIDVVGQNLALAAELEDAFARVLRSGRYILGPEVEALESEIAHLAGAKYGIGVSSGTDALLLALMALDIGPGDEVICPAFTFFASAGSIARTGATPVFADICPHCFNIDPADAEGRVTEKTKAIMPVHLYGQSADMDPIVDLAQKHGLAIVEDAAQAIGAKYKGAPVGGIGDFGAFSFYPTKNLGALGDAGMLVTSDDSLAARARKLRVHGGERRYYHEEVGGNFRIDEVQAALLRIKLRRLGDYEAAREANARFYRDAFAALGDEQPHPSSCCGLSDSSPTSAPLALPSPAEGRCHTWNQFTLRVGGGRRDHLKDFLAAKGIGAEVYYPLCLDQQKCFAGNARGGDSVRAAHSAAAECLSLPIYPELTTSCRDRVADAILGFFAA